MKIGIICYPSCGGSGVVATELGYALADQGHLTHFISSDRPFRMVKNHQNIFFHKVEEIKHPVFNTSPHTLLLANKIAEVSINESLDLLHVHYAIPHGISAFIAKQMLSRRIPLVTTLHGTDVTLVNNYSEFFSLTRLVLQKSEAITAVSHSLARDTLSVFGHDIGQVEVIPNFITPYFTSECDLPVHSHKKDNIEKVITHVSNFREVKRVSDVVRIFAAVNEKVPARLLLVGDGPEMGSVLHEIDLLGLNNRVQLLGMRNDVLDILRSTDIFLLPSGQESFGLAALEAMSCGVPVVASKVGGLPEVINDGQTGYLKDPGDIAGMSQAVIDLLTDEQLYQKFSEYAKVWARSRFTLKKAVQRYIDVYKRVL